MVILRLLTIAVNLDYCLTPQLVRRIRAMKNSNKTMTTQGLIAYILATLFLLYEMAIQSSPSIMAAPIMQELHLNAAIFGTAMGMYFYSYTLMQIPAGLLFDRVSIRLLLILAIGLCILGNLLFATTHEALWLGIARIIIGMGSAFSFIAVLVIADHWFPSRRFALLVGIAQLVAAIGAMSGELPLSFLLNHTGWRHAAMILAGIGLLLAIGVFVVIRDQRSKIPATTQARVSTSLLTIIRNPQTLWVGFYAFTSWAPIALFAELWGVPYLMDRFNITNVIASTCTAMIWLALALASPYLGWYSNHIGKRCSLLQWSSIIGLITSTLILFVTPHSLLINTLLLLGMGIAGAGQILTFAVVKDINEPQHLATAIGFNNMAVVVGGAIFQPLVGLLLQWHATRHGLGGEHIYSLEDYTFALTAIPFCYIGGWLVSRYKIQETDCM